jgi:hypothetical protein
MPRTTAELVAGLVEQDVKSVPDLTPFIATANILVTRVCGSAGYSDEEIEMIERWLAAHFYCMRDPRATYETARSVAQSLQNKVDLGLATSHYGQQAMILDTKGGLARLNSRIVKGILMPGSPLIVAGKKCDVTDN